MTADHERQPAHPDAPVETAATDGIARYLRTLCAVAHAPGASHWCTPGHNRGGAIAALSARTGRERRGDRGGYRGGCGAMTWQPDPRADIAPLERDLRAIARYDHSVAVLALGSALPVRAAHRAGAGAGHPRGDLRRAVRVPLDERHDDAQCPRADGRRVAGETVLIQRDAHVSVFAPLIHLGLRPSTSRRATTGSAASLSASRPRRSPPRWTRTRRSARSS